MPRGIDPTHDPRLSSWVPSANQPSADFPIQNLPYGVFSTGGGGPRVGVAIGDRVLDLHGLAEDGPLADVGEAVSRACRAPFLNDVMALGPESWGRLRRRLSALLSDGSDPSLVERRLVPLADVALHLPARIGDYTDFYASIYHATNVGRLFRPESPLLPNYKWVPIGYHGRASSVLVGGEPVRRPLGQRRPPDAEVPVFGASRMLDYEVELGAFVGPGNELGVPVPAGEAEEHLFGVCLLNDWSARDIQAWEYQPLGPFLAKSFATTVSPWIVTMDALAPFRGPTFAREAADPAPLPHLGDGVDPLRGGIDVVLEAYLHTQKMRVQGLDPVRLSRVRTLDLYWTLSQLIAHHTSNGCNLRPGDLMGSGTVSGPSRDSLGSLLEITRRGQEPLDLPSGETRVFLEDGDEVILRGYCEREGFRRIGLGACRGRVLASVSLRRGSRASHRAGDPTTP